LPSKDSEYRSNDQNDSKPRESTADVCAKVAATVEEDEEEATRGRGRERGRGTKCARLSTERQIHPADISTLTLREVFGRSPRKSCY
jgi:hypothetical protein